MNSRAAHCLLAAVAVVVISACAEGEAKDTGSVTTTTGTGTSVQPPVVSVPGMTTGASATGSSSYDALGTPLPASGTPVKIGYYTDGPSAVTDGDDEYEAAEATFKYVNDYLGGLAGHPIDVVPCDGNNDAALSAVCGNQFVSEGVAAVLFNTAEATTFIAPVAAAGIPILAFQSADAGFFAVKDGFVITSPITELATFPISIAKTKGYTKAAVIITDVPEATGPAKIGAYQWHLADIPQPDIIAIPPDAPSMVSRIDTALDHDPQLVHIIGDAAFCTPAISALRAADYQGDISMINNCIEPSTINTLGDQLEGILVSYPAGENPANRDNQTFQAILDKYASDKDIATTGTPLGAFTVAVAFSRAMQAAPGELTPASIAAALRDAPPQPMPTIDGAEFQCNGYAATGIPACTAAFAVATLDESGQPTNHTVG